MNAKKLYNILLVVIIILMQISTIVFYWKNEKDNLEYVKDVTLWSTLEGAAGSRMVLSKENPEIRQTFVNQHEKLEEMILFFYHCGEAQSGKIFVRIKDQQGNVFYDFAFEPLYMEQDVFCLVASPEENTVLVPNEEYVIEITAENMDAEDYVEVGTTRKPSKPYIYREVQDGEALFVKLDYSYVDLAVPKEMVQRIVCIWLLVDSILLLLYMLMIKKAYKTVLVTVGLAAVICGGILLVRGYVIQHKWYNQYTYIAHAMGRIDGKDYTNSKDAFEKTYQEGHRVFEVDFSITSDNQIVLKHDWTSEHGLPDFEEGYIPTLQEFKEAKIWGKYTTMDMADLLQIMVEYPDIYIVTDSKSGEYKEVVEQFRQMKEMLQKYSERERKSIQKRIIVQIYNDDMYAGVESVMHFDNYIYTLYQRGCNNLEQLTEFCIKNQIQVVTIPYTWWTEEIQETLEEQGLSVWVHTINSKEQVDEFAGNGVNGFYTDMPDMNDKKWR